VIVLYQIPGAWGASSISPFCIKLETFLKMADLPYEERFGDPRKSPSKKVPWIDDEGTVVTDSQRCIAHLCRKHGVDLDARLDARQRTTGHALRRMLEEATYFPMVWLRWGNDEGWAEYRKVMLGFAPKVIGGPILAMIRRTILGQLFAQGTGRHAPESINDFVIADFMAVSEVLGDKPYLFGDEPTTFDATVYGFLASVLAFPVASKARTFLQKQDNLIRYDERVRTRYFEKGASS